MSILELPSHNDRESVLQKIRDSSFTMKDGSQAIEFKFAKSKKQLRRDASIHRAAEMIKKESKSSITDEKIEWKTSVKGRRCIKIGTQEVFIQEPGDMTGSFFHACAHLQLD